MNPYKTLGVRETDSEDEIRQRYKKLALQYHPDKNKDPSAIEKFKEISEAYQLIRGGDNMVDELPELHEMFNLFQGLFGGNMVFKQPKGPVTRADILLSLEEIYCGGKFKVQYQKKQFTGRMGQTSEIRQMGPIAIQEIKIEPEFIWEDATLEFELLPGYPIDQPILVEMEDHTVSIEVRVKKHPTFTRLDSDLGITLDITLWESLLGFSRTIKQLDSRELELNCKSIVTPDTVKEIDDEGMPLPNGDFGKLFVKFQIKFPEELTTEQRTLLEQLAN